MYKLNEFGAVDVEHKPDIQKWITVCVVIFIILISAFFIYKNFDQKEVADNLTEEERIIRSMKAGEKSTLTSEEKNFLKDSMSSSGESNITPSQMKILKESMKSQ